MRPSEIRKYNLAQLPAGDIPASAGVAGIKVKGITFVPGASAATFSTRRYTGVGGALQPNSGKTYTTLFAFPFDVVAVQPVFSNWMATDFVDVTASVCAMASKTSVSGALRPVTVNGASSFKINKALAATLSNGLQEFPVVNTVGDVMPIQTVPRNDGGSARIIAVRSCIPLASNPNEIVVGKYGVSNSLDEFMVFQRSGVGKLTAVGQEAAALTDTNLGAPISLIGYAKTPVVTVMAVGDGLTSGTGHTTTTESGVDKAVRSIQVAGKAWDLVNLGHASSTMNGYFFNGVDVLETFRPGIAFFSVGSHNDADRYTADWASRALCYAVQWIDACRSLGVIPGLVTMAPSNGLSVDAEAVRRALVADTIAIATAHGVPVVDRSAVWTNTSNSAGGFLPGLNSDATYPSTAGYELEKDAWLAVLDRIASV